MLATTAPCRRECGAGDRGGASSGELAAEPVCGERSRFQKGGGGERAILRKLLISKSVIQCGVSHASTRAIYRIIRAHQLHTHGAHTYAGAGGGGSLAGGPRGAPPSIDTVVGRRAAPPPRAARAAGKRGARAVRGLGGSGGVCIARRGTCAQKGAGEPSELWTRSRPTPAARAALSRPAAVLLTCFRAMSSCARVARRVELRRAISVMDKERTLELATRLIHLRLTRGRVRLVFAPSCNRVVPRPCYFGAPCDTLIRVSLIHSR